MQLKSQIWVQAYIRRCNVAGAAALLVRHGDDEAGAIFIKVAPLNGHAAVYGPAPMGFDDAAPGRRFSQHLAPETTERDADAYLARQHEFDPDLWVVEVEDRAGRHFLDDGDLTDSP